MKTKHITEQGVEYEVNEGYYPDGKISCQEWYVNGQLHREGDRPAYIAYYGNGNISSQEWLLNGQCHREGDKPAYISYHPNGNIKYQEWYVNGQLHRENDRPAHIIYHENGNKNYQRWYRGGQLHREGDKPAYVTYYPEGNIKSQEWFRNGQRHREGGEPAYISYYPDGKIRSQQWYLYGVRVTSKFIKNKEWEKMSINDILSEYNAQKRMMLLKLVGVEKIIQEGQYRILEEIKGIELYRKYPIGDYYQQGDVLVKPDPINQVNFDDIDEKTKVRLSKITYKLIQIDKFKYLQMNNPSHNDLIHIEGVANHIRTVFEAICFRNKVNYLPMALA